MIEFFKILIYYKTIKYFIIILLCILTYSCINNDDYFKEDTLTIYNSSEDDIYFSKRTVINMPQNKPTGNRLIPSHSSFSGKDNYREALYNGDKLYIWIYSTEVIDNTPWEEVKQNNMYLVRYEFTLEDLERMNWEIVYNGN